VGGEVEEGGDYDHEEDGSFEEEDESRFETEENFEDEAEGDAIWEDEDRMMMMEDEYDDEQDDEMEEGEDGEELDEQQRLEWGGDTGVVQDWYEDQEGSREAVAQKIASDREYHRTFHADEAETKWHSRCRNGHKECTKWALEGECDNNKQFMRTSCPVACHSCDWIDTDRRCQPDPGGVDFFMPGDLDRLFERIATDPEIQRRFRPAVLSRPAYAPGDTAETAPYQLGMWLVLLHSFLTEEEAGRMVELAERSGLKPSEGGHVNEDGIYVSSVSDYRTSWNTVRVIAGTPCCFAAVLVWSATAAGLPPPIKHSL
jgi:hypothetical protein